MVLVFTIGACSLTASLNGLSSGGLGGPGADGGYDGAADATLDGGLADGFTAHGRSAPFCSSQQPPAFFCADFDEGDLTKVYESGTLASVASPDVSTGCTESIGGGARSAPGALLTEFPATATSQSLSLRVRYAMPLSAPAKGSTLQFDMQLQEYQTGQEIDFGSLTMDDPNGGPQIRSYVIVQASGKPELSLYNGSTYQYAQYNLPLDGQWHTYRLDLDLDPSLRSRLFVDDAQVADVPHTASFTSSPKASFYLGPTVVPPSNAVRIALDNAFVRLR
jgi:hypothetical protein